ncbi:MAG: hypothetical protein QF714_08305 [Dehalococcoidia bacterium]|nr:hypothetical protein [Dehalococcoidia bacterium]MDP6227687.1 hypothetical protein [Dehalococcoidia bacterium]MDP7085206.1 hypothetical protein [Dehalococcoidia bacterium]MDP7200561.1 hypothetical protein [Dehalococcoidia bacterium]MDP7511825.1 hypothetical protein [Dehalococcoidia bacterium]
MSRFEGRAAGSSHRGPAPQHHTAGHLDHPVQAAEKQELFQVNIDAPGLPGQVRRYQQLDSVSPDNPVPGSVPPADVGIDRYLYTAARSRRQADQVYGRPPALLLNLGSGIIAKGYIHQVSSAWVCDSKRTSGAQSA